MLAFMIRIGTTHLRTKFNIFGQKTVVPYEHTRWVRYIRDNIFIQFAVLLTTDGRPYGIGSVVGRWLAAAVC